MSVFSTDTGTPITTYRQKKALVDSLRRKQEALSAMGDQPSTIRTGASGAFPGMTRANTAGAVTNALKTYMQAKLAAEGGAQEADAATARSQAIQGILPDDMDRISPQQALQLQELGVDVGQLKGFQPKKEPLANLLQNIGSLTEESADVLAAQYGMDPEQLRSMIRASREQRTRESEAEFEREKALRVLGVKPEKPSDYDLYQKDPEGYAKFKAVSGTSSDEFTKARDKAAGKAAGELLAEGGAGKSEFKLAEMEAFEEKLRQDVLAGDDSTTGAYVADLVAERFGVPPEKLPSSRNEKLAMRAQLASQFAVDAASQLKGQGQVTENERKMIKDTQFSALDTPQLILQKMQRIKAIVAENARREEALMGAAREGGVGGLTATSPTGESTAERLARIRAQKGGK